MSILAVAWKDFSDEARLFAWRAQELWDARKAGLPIHLKELFHTETLMACARIRNAIMDHIRIYPDLELEDVVRLATSDCSGRVSPFTRCIEDPSTVSMSEARGALSTIVNQWCDLSRAPA